MVPVSSLAAGADECWGMIIFNEDYLLYDADKVSTSWVVYIARTIAHEMSHLVRRNKSMRLYSIHNTYIYIEEHFVFKTDEKTDDLANFS